MDPVIKQAVEAVMEICIETLEIIDRNHPDESFPEYTDYEDIFNQVYAEIAKATQMFRIEAV